MDAGTPASGSTFPIGTTTVTCHASDAAGSESSASFTVHVKGAAEQLAGHVVPCQGGLRSPHLVSEARAGPNAFGRIAKVGTCSILKAFINQVTAQSGKSIEAGTATTLIADATRIRAVLGC